MIKNQQGKIVDVVLIMVAILVIAQFFSSPKPPKATTSDTPINITSSTYDAAQSHCQGGLYGAPPNGVETYEAHPWQSEDDNDITILYKEPQVTYKLVRAAVPRYARQTHSTLYIPDKDKDIIRGKKSKVYFTNGDYSVPKQGKVRFAEYGLAYVIPLNAEGKIDVVELSDVKGRVDTYILTDVYQRADKPDFPLAAFDCSKNVKAQDLAALAAKKGKDNRVIKNPQTIKDIGTEIIFPEEQKESKDKKELQLEYFVFGAPKKFESSSEGIWIPGCKPAIYLYPKEKTKVTVKVKTTGFLTLTIPPYPESGWQALTYPNGTIEVDGKTFSYLYYESKIPDELINKPKEGYVVEFDQLTNLFNHLLPKLGLNETQKKDFIDYWTKALPYSAYYSIGIMDQTHIDEIEPLEITPKPDYINRVRIYFEALDKKPTLENLPVLHPASEGGASLPYTPNPNFKVIEWGGMVKTDKLHPFTCSQ